MYRLEVKELHVVKNTFHYQGLCHTIIFYLIENIRERTTANLKFADF